jgi:hypothetical protein
MCIAARPARPVRPLAVGAQPLYPQQQPTDTPLSRVSTPYMPCPRIDQPVPQHTTPALADDRRPGADSAGSRPIVYRLRVKTTQPIAECFDRP